MSGRCLILALLWLACFASARADTIPPLPERLADHWEAVAALAAANDLAPGEWDTFLETLEELLDQPLSINDATADELGELPGLDAMQIAALLDYRQRYGPLLSIYELQAVPGWDVPTIRALLPFIRLSANDARTDWRSALRFGESQLYLRSEWRSDAPPFRPLKSYLRYKFTGGRRLRLGLTMEKDAGEAWWTPYSPYGVDFLSAHAELRAPFGKLNRLWLGDYHLRLGQGLLVWTGFAPAYGPDAVAVVRSNVPIRPYTSSQESGFLRGLAAEWQAAPSWRLWTFASLAGRDATTCCTPDSIVSFSAFRTSGLHRSQDDYARRGAVRERLLGLRLQFERGGGHIALNALHQHYSLPRRPQPRLDNAFQPTGTDLWMASLDGQWVWRNVLLFGEAAVQAHGATALTGGLVLTLGRHLRLAWQARAFDRAFYSEYAQPVARWSRAANEQGHYLGLEWRLSAKWTLDAWHDWYRSPWLRFNEKAPTDGTAARLRITFTPWRHVEWYAEWRLRSEWGTRTATGAAVALNRQQRRQQWLVQLVVPLDEAWTWRTRLTLSQYDDESSRQAGLLWYHDFLYRPMGRPWSLTSRLAVFRTQGWESRIYAYENDLLYNLSLPAFYDHGARAYLNLRWRPLRALTLEGRVAVTRPLGLPTRPEDEPPQPTSWQLKGQVRFEF